ncbi:MAG: transglutaminase TgpA family protein [Candidatus Limnocylindrales bacterium]
MNSISTKRSLLRSQVDAQTAEQDELSDLPMTPREGWVSVISLSVMLVTVGIAIDDARWVGEIGGSSTSQSGFLPILGLFSVLVGAALAKSHYSRYAGHLIGAVIGAAFLLNAVATSISIAPSFEGRLQDLNLSVSRWVEEVVVIGTRSYETSIFLIVLGALVWGAGQFAAYAVFRRHKPLPAVLLTGFMLMVNVGITVRDQYLHLVIFVAAALVLLIRLNLLDQAREWRARGMRDVADVSQAFMRNGAAFVAIAIIAATTLAANASSAPLSRAWQNLDDDLLEVGYSINRWLGGISGSARGPNILFTPSQTIRGVWESSSELVFTANVSDKEEHRWRGANYDSSDGNTWQPLDRQSVLVDVGAELLVGSKDMLANANGRHVTVVTVMPADYGGDVIVAPESPQKVDQQAEIQVNGPDGPFVAAKLVYGIQPDVPYTVTSMVRDKTGKNRLTGNELAVAGTSYPDWVDRYLAIRPGSVGDLVRQTAADILESLPANKRDPYHVAVAVQDYLYESGGFQYETDVSGMCEDTSRMVDCFLEIKQGYCEFFASAMTMLMRELGVPARYVLGYLPGQEMDDGSWRVDRSAAHAWVEVYFPGHGWVPFDPTPGNGENGQERTILPDGEDRGPAPTSGNLQGGGGELECADQIDCQTGAPIPGSGGPPPPPSTTAASNWTSMLAVASIILALMAAAMWAALRRVPQTEPELAYRGVARMATRLGYGPRPSQTAYEFAAGLGELVPIASGDLKMIATAKVEATYGRRTPGETMRRSLGIAYRRVRLGLLRLVIRRPKLGLRPRFTRSSR